MEGLWGYAGKMLEVDLSANKIKQRELSPRFCQECLGGTGFNARIVYDEVPPGADALGPDNVLVFSVGTLVGSPFPTASRTEVSAKSPITGLFGTSNSGMFFGLGLRKCGYDGVIVKGQAPRGVYLLIEGERAEIRDASDLWGKDAWESLDILKARHGECQVALIGPAGENLVKFASIENGYYDAWARTGLGAVMGSKRLKAVVIKGNQRVKICQPDKMFEVANKARELIQSSPFFVPFKSYGSMNAAIPYGNFNALATHNFTQGCLPDWHQEFARSRVEGFIKRNVACHACIIACAHWVEIKDGKYRGLRMKDMEVTPVVSFGSQVGLKLEAVVKASEMGQRLGMDMVSAAGVIAMAIELFEQGFLSREEVGYDLAFGDDEAVLKLMHDIAYRQGIGDVLAEGTKRAGHRLRGGEERAMHVKGLELPMIDPRGRWSTWTLGMLTNVRGGDHLRCRNPVENLRYNENRFEYQKERFGLGRKVYQELDMPRGLKEQTIDIGDDTVDVALMSKWAEDLINLFNSVGVCIRPPVLHGVGPTVLAEAYTAFTGLEMTPDALMLAAERAWNLMKLFNLREGEKPEDSAFPRRFYEQRVKGNALDEEKTREVLKKYYHARGWDPETGKPTEEKLRQLGIIF
ncbi:MAG: aldehyde ferredoxin oxidoreductase family protein [Syntrophothermus sp.]|uniref:aldehyde ferredoxin oxidoreductase family protein n=1 Tax=Syntrophothermus sp. TaxID=2736299 RepID=UPI00257A9914|nr:aldehyde ferredoxin oxidoreductase family protein [Syntrophothermus sp.]NSW84176.1 aldehyde ferredoxin oxidoreductase family protein [Syntrophothermus sp.]